MKRQKIAPLRERILRANMMVTQGRKGCKVPRITMAFSPLNHDFIKTMAKIFGMTSTEFVNFVLDTYREKHGELYRQVQALKEAFIKE